MLENISGLLNLDAEQKYKIALVGVPKAGKSWLALSMPGSIYVAECDGREESAKEYIRQSGRKDIFIKSYRDLDPETPHAVIDLETDISMLEYEKKQGKPIPETYVLDSMTFLRKYCEFELMKQHPAMSRKIKLGVNSLKISQGWDVVNGNKQYLEYIIGRLGELGNVIAVFHEQDEKDNQRSTKEEKKYTGRVTIQPQYLSSILSMFNDVFRVSLDYSSKRIVTCQPDSDFVASASMKLEQYEEPDLSKMIAKHKQNVAKTKS